MEDNKNEGTNTTSMQGRSRAAKKRAKQREKKRERIDVVNHDDNQDNIHSGTVETSQSKKQATRQDKHRTAIKKMNDCFPMDSTNDPNGHETQPVKERREDSEVKLLAGLVKNITELSTSKGQIGHAVDMTSKERARLALQFLLADTTTIQNFYDEYWEKKPLCVQRTSTEHRQRFDGLLSKKSITETILNHPLYYGRDVNVTRYEKDRNGVKRRVTFDKVKPAAEEDVGEMDPSDVRQYVRVDRDELWKYYKDGCTIRLLCPHQHANELQSLLSLLELEWGCMVGANAYLTPPGRSQGFAPHYDDIEAFCIQLEGCKRWKVYPPRSETEQLPRYSSRDFTDDDIKDLEPVLDVVLEPGDVLYMPRGWIHQACTLPPGKADIGYSLHVTISCMQCWAWADLIEMLLPQACQAAVENETVPLLRRGLPRGFLEYMGVMHDKQEKTMPDSLRSLVQSIQDDEERVTAQEIRLRQESFRHEAKQCMMKVMKEAMDMIDFVCDEMGKRFIADRQPPAWTEKEKETICDDSELEDNAVLPSCLVRLARPGIARLNIEDGKAIVYHCKNNSRVFHENAVSPLEYELDDAPALEQMLTTVEPNWICVADLIHDSVEDKVGVADSLIREGIVAMLAPDLS